MMLPAADSHSFTSTTRGANAKIITTSPYNFSGPAVWMIPVSDEIYTFVLRRLNEILCFCWSTHL